MRIQCVLFLIATLFGSAISQSAERPVANSTDKNIALGGGCFWCVEAVFQQFKGVTHVESGYAGGATDSPDYRTVSYGDSGHAEVIQVYFDPSVITEEQILTIFFHAHDPTTLNQQGNDRGTEYRSIILFNSEEQKELALKVKDSIESQKIWGDKKLVTEIAPLKKFYRAEEYHQNYYANNPSKPYCSLVIGPKIQKVRKEFKELLKG